MKGPPQGPGSSCSKHVSESATAGPLGPQEPVGVVQSDPLSVAGLGALTANARSPVHTQGLGHPGAKGQSWARCSVDWPAQEPAIRVTAAVKVHVTKPGTECLPGLCRCSPP